MKENCKAVDSNTPAINKSLPIIKWTEDFREHLHSCLVARMIPLAYVIQNNESVPGPCPTLKTDQLFSENNGLVDEEHMDTDCTRQIIPTCTSSWRRPLVELLKPISILNFQRNKTGRGACMALLIQYAGSDKWESVIKNRIILCTQKNGKAREILIMSLFFRCIGMHVYPRRPHANIWITNSRMSIPGSRTYCMLLKATILACRPLWPA